MKEGADPSLLPDDLKEFFTSKDEFLGTTYRETRQQIQWRLRLLLDNTSIGRMFSTSTTKLDMGELMDSGKVVVINNSKALLGDDGAEFFGRFFLALILGAAQRRATQRNKFPCYVYIDEAQSVIKRDEKITTILDECRSQKIALILAHQRCAQLMPPVLDAVSNCAVRYTNADDDATYLAPKFRVSADRLRSLELGQFQCYVRDIGSFYALIEKPELPPEMTPKEYAALRARMKRYCEEEHSRTYEHTAEHTTPIPDTPSTDASKDW